ncbi:hypothetical protein T484DRAFT_1864091, partial [Baffinella frigidus]
VIPGGAAEHAGILEGDVVDAVNGVDLEGKTLVQARAVLLKAPSRFDVVVSFLP